MRKNLQAAFYSQRHWQESKCWGKGSPLKPQGSQLLIWTNYLQGQLTPVCLEHTYKENQKTGLWFNCLSTNKSSSFNITSPIFLYFNKVQLRPFWLLHEWLLGGVSHSFPSLCRLGRGQSQGTHRRLGKRHAQVRIGPSLFPLYAHILPSQTPQFGLDQRFSFPSIEFSEIPVCITLRKTPTWLFDCQFTIIKHHLIIDWIKSNHVG